MRLFSFLGLLSIFIMAILNDFENRLIYLFIYYTRKKYGQLNQYKHNLYLIQNNIVLVLNTVFFANRIHIRICG